MSAYALFINGVFRNVLEEILEALAKEPGRIYYLQPHSGSPIVGLQKDPPSESLRVPLYMSTTDDLKSVSYKAEIVVGRTRGNLAKCAEKRSPTLWIVTSPTKGDWSTRQATEVSASISLASGDLKGLLNRSA